MAGYYDGLIDYVDFGQLWEDYDLSSGDLPLDDQATIEEILKRFVISNKNPRTER